MANKSGGKMIKKILIALSVGAVLSTVFLSKSFNDNYFLPCYFGNVFIISMLLLLQVVVSIFSAKKKEMQISFSINDIALLSWYGVSAISVLLSHGNFNNPFFIHFTLLLLLYFVLQQNLKEGILDYFSLFSWILFIAGVFQMLYGILQFLGIMKTNGLFRVVGNFGNPGLLSMYLTILFLWFFGLAIFKHTNKTLRYASILLCIVSFVFIVFLINRASWIVLALCIPLVLQLRYGIFSFFFRLNAAKKFIVSVVIVAGIVATLLFLYNIKKASSDGRLFIWQRTVEMIKDHPIAGVGYNTFTQNYNLYQAAYFRNHPIDSQNIQVADSISSAFNEFLQTTSEIGVIGLLAFLVVLFFAVRQLFKMKQSEEINSLVLISIAQIIIVGFIIFSFVSYPFRIIAHSTLFFIFLSISTFSSKSLISLHIRLKSWKMIIGSFAVVVFGFLMYQTNQMSSYKTWQKMMISMQSGDRNGLLKMNALYPSLEHDNVFLFNYGTMLSLSGEYVKSNDILEKAKLGLQNYNVYAYLGNNYEALQQLEKAKDCFEMADNLIPSRMYTKYRLFILYDKLKDTRAIPMAQKLLNMPAKGISENADLLRKKAKEFLESKKQSNGSF